MAMPPPTGNHYVTLELEPTASAEDVRKAHRRLARKRHPDKVADPSDEVAVRTATRQFQQLQAAYEVLSDPAKRRRYDVVYGVSHRIFKFTAPKTDAGVWGGAPAAPKTKAAPCPTSEQGSRTGNNAGPANRRPAAAAAAAARSRPRKPRRPRWARK